MEDHTFINLFKKTFPLVKLFKNEENLFAYDAKSNFLTEVDMEDLHLIYDLWINNEICNTKFKLLKERGVFIPGPLSKITPENEELESIIKNQINNYLPRKFVLEVTENCTLKCSYCLFSDEVNVRSHSLKEMSVETAFSAIDYYFNRYFKLLSNISLDSRKKILSLTSPGLSWWGGEPFYNFDLIVKTKNYIEALPWHLIGIKTSDLVYSVATNFTILNDDIMNFIVDNNIYLFISLDGGKNEHDLNRTFHNGKGSFDTVISNINKIINKHPQFCKEKLIIQSVLADNFKHERSLEFIEKYFKINTYEQTILDSQSFPVKKIKQPIAENKDKITEEDLLKESEKNLKKLNKLSYDELNLYLNINKTLYNKLKYLLSLEDNFTFENPIGKNQYSYIFSCPIGCDIIFVDTEGNIHMCNKTDYSMPIGDIKNDINFNLTYETYSDYIKGYKLKCIDCWAFKHCKVCPASALYKKTFYYPSIHDCKNIKREIAVNIGTYILLTTKYESLYKKLKKYYNNKQNSDSLTSDKPISLEGYRN